MIPLGAWTTEAATQIEAVRGQELAGEFEIVVAANCVLDAAQRHEIQQCLRRCDVLLAAADRRGAAFARNRGVEAASAPLVAFCDSDDVVAAGWLREHVDRLAEADISLGTLDKERLNGPMSQNWARAFPSVPGVARDFLLSGPSANLAVRRDAFEQLGGFDEFFTGAAGEDVDLCWRAQLAGFRVLVASDAVVYYRLRSSVRGVWRQSLSYARWEVALFARYRSKGMTRAPFRRVFRDYAWLVKHALGAIMSLGARGEWVGSLAVRVGRLVGSLERRVWYP